MTRLTPSTRVLILELRVNSERDTVHLVEQVARVLDVDIGEQDSQEWVQPMHVRKINPVRSGAND